MNTLISLLGAPLGHVMRWCYGLLGSYGPAILLFTLITKVILLPIGVWVHKNSIKVVRIQPELNRVKAKFFGDRDAIAEEQSKLYKREGYHPLVSLIPLFIQIILLMGLVNVIYHPFDHLLRLPRRMMSGSILLIISSPSLRQWDRNTVSSWEELKHILKASTAMPLWTR